MHRSRSLLVTIATVICLAAVIAACGGPAPGETPSPESTEPTAQPTETGGVSPLPPAQSPLPTPTDVTDTGEQPVTSGPVELLPPGKEPGSTPAPLVGQVPQDLLDAVIDDLAQRLGVDREAITVEQAGAVIWRDGSLGCPQPGMSYTQALVAGYQIVLRVGEAPYDYHASAGGYFLLCPPGMAEEGLPPGDGDVPLEDQ